MYADFFGSQYPNPDEQNMPTVYFLTFNAIPILMSVWSVHFIYNWCRCKKSAPQRQPEQKAE